MFVQLVQLTSVTGDGSFGDLLVYLLTGFIIVFSVLCLLWLAVTIMGKLFQVLDLKDPIPENVAKPYVPPTVSAPSVQPTSAVQVTPELMAVVGAALHTVIQGPFKIVSVEESKTPPKS